MPMTRNRTAATVGLLGVLAGCALTVGLFKLSTAVPAAPTQRIAVDAPAASEAPPVSTVETVPPAPPVTEAPAVAPVPSDIPARVSNLEARVDVLETPTTQPAAAAPAAPAEPDPAPTPTTAPPADFDH